NPMIALESLDTFRCFAGNTLFEGIQSEVLEDIRYQMKTVRLKQGEVIFEEGDAGDSLYLVGEGSIKISKTGRGGQQETLGYIEPGNFFGEMALFDGQPRSANATAASSALVAAVDERTFQRILELAPSRLHMNFLRSVSERLRQVNSHFISEVMRSERLSLVGSMANSIIHDLKNPICIVRCCADLISHEVTDARTKELTAMIDGAVDGMLEMTQELLDYARGFTTIKKETVSMWRLLDDLSQQSLRLLPGLNIHFVKHIRYQGDVELDLPRFIRMLGNLIKNAAEAMPGGGILTMTTDLVQDQIVLRLSDTGCGIPSEIMPKLFEPFVTHGKSHGTGLGMAIAKSVVEAHGGRISVASISGNGTTVDIRLPAPAAEAAA
ncbi:MAG: cyclic nucleotide-binding domain-containing protein, partial [Verrucomicrobiota bacterium]|nr:cyclic nucleotide-binding domain-containing protein [Verrucomicrobiota bacterium]